MKRQSLPEGRCVGHIDCAEKAVWVVYDPIVNRFVTPFCTEHMKEIQEACDAGQIQQGRALMLTMPSRS